MESLGEMLSDVVARRRLRANKSQIAETAAATRMKRIQFEDMLNSWSTVSMIYICIYCMVYACMCGEYLSHPQLIAQETYQVIE